MVPSVACCATSFTRQLVPNPNRAQRRAAERGKHSAFAQEPRRARADVAVGYLHPNGNIDSNFAKCLRNLADYDRQTNGRLGPHLEMVSGANIVTARNLVVRQFLETSATWLFLIDSDMTFAPTVVDQLLDAADVNERPIVGGLCFALSSGEGQLIVPTIYNFNGEGRMVRQYGYPENTLFPVAGTGAACLLVHRRVFEGILEKTVTEQLAAATGMPVGQRMFGPPWPWFAETATGPDWGDTAGEDLTFCVRAGACGFPIFVDTRVKIGHVKPFIVDEALYRMFLPKVEAPAPTFVVIPVKGKHQFTTSILSQLNAQGGFEQLFLYDNAAGTSDSVSDWVDDDYLDGNVTVIPAAGMNIHEMWNAGIKRALAENERCNIAILNNDLELGPDFLKEMADGLRAHPSIAAVSGNYDGRDFVEKVQAVKGIAAGREDGTGGFAGFAMMFRGELFVAGCPLFDEELQFWYGDNLMLMHLEKAGATYGIVRDAHVKHIGGGSQTSGDGKGHRLTPELAAIVEKDQERFEKIVANW